MLLFSLEGSLKRSAWVGITGKAGSGTSSRKAKKRGPSGYSVPVYVHRESIRHRHPGKSSACAEKLLLLLHVVFFSPKSSLAISILGTSEKREKATGNSSCFFSLSVFFKLVCLLQHCRSRAKRGQPEGEREEEEECQLCATPKRSAFFPIVSVLLLLLRLTSFLLCKSPHDCPWPSSLVLFLSETLPRERERAEFGCVPAQPPYVLRVDKREKETAVREEARLEHLVECSAKERDA